MIKTIIYDAAGEDERVARGFYGQSVTIFQHSVNAFDGRHRGDSLSLTFKNFIIFPNWFVFFLTNKTVT